MRHIGWTYIHYTLSLLPCETDAPSLLGLKIMVMAAEQLLGQLHGILDCQYYRIVDRPFA